MRLGGESRSVELIVDSIKRYSSLAEQRSKVEQSQSFLRSLRSVKDAYCGDGRSSTVQTAEIRQLMVVEQRVADKQSVSLAQLQESG